ncbi:MAG: hypothetical protein AAGF79_03175 [Pseudomonadota bacterium]
MTIEDLRNPLTAIGLAVSVMLMTGAQGDAAKADSNPSTERDIAVIDIPHPKQGNLLMLRGLAGAGTATFRVNDACLAMPVRFVAGDFSGQSADIGRTGSIRIVITAPEVMRGLLEGRDLVSDMVRVTADSTDQAADLYLAHGISADTGFVINPGQNLLADILGASTTNVECPSLTTPLP